MIERRKGSRRKDEMTPDEKDTAQEKNLDEWIQRTRIKRTQKQQSSDSIKQKKQYIPRHGK